MNLTTQHWNWIAVGFGLGASIGIATDNVAMWIAVGIAFGAIVALVNKNNGAKYDEQHK